MARIHSHTLEKVISTVMVLFGFAAVGIFAYFYPKGMNPGELAIIEILLIIVLAILAQTIILVRIYEQR